MSEGIASLHKVLKDETRRKIILLLSDKGSLSYVDLMKELQITSTGKMNYHLKILSDLLAKNEAGHYTLTEKGKLASRLLLEFPEENRTGKPKWWRRFWLESLIFIISFTAIFSAAYILGYINSYSLYQNLISLIFIIGFSYMIQHILRDILSKKTKLAIAKTVYIGGGIVLGLAAAFIGGGIALSGLSGLLGETFAPGNPAYTIFWSAEYLVFSLLIAPTIGALGMYRFGKKRRFRTANYNPDG
jgi:hypothetical protein